MSKSQTQLGRYAGAVAAAVQELEAKRAVSRLWEKDPTLWKTDPAHTKIIANSLGWLRVIDVVRPEVEALEAFAGEVASAGFRHVVLMGMGGSSLCPEVLRRTNVPMAGHPELIVLDSTVPATVRRVQAAIDPARTLFIVASKSGTTIEPSVFYAYFFDVVKGQKGAAAGDNFVAITDPGTVMVEHAERDRFRRIFKNPSDIGGRYSALSFFGMVPAALMGLDVGVLLDRAAAMARSCGPETPIAQNPGAQLGAVLGALARDGRDKVTLITPPPLEAVGLWIEQLIAESTGKEGKGILPVAGEPLGPPSVYGQDRVFVVIRTADADDAEREAALKIIREAGHPVVEHVLQDPMDLGAEFFRWEAAVALAGLLIGIDPFDQPNVQESKDNTNKLLKEFEQSRKLTEPPAFATYGPLALSADPANRGALQVGVDGADGDAAAVACLKAHLGRVHQGDYFAITQYIDEEPHRDTAILAVRTRLRDSLQVATTTGYGPRFLHSTGQLHKGGSDAGVFLQLTADDGNDLPIPGQPYGFATLVKAQALGDFQSLAARHRRALRVYLGNDVDSGLKALGELIEKALG